MNMAARRLVKPVYKRQQFLLSFFKKLNEPLTATEFQKLLFLYHTRTNLSYYDFVPYLYGCQWNGTDKGGERTAKASWADVIYYRV
jgi:hypothetical protein